MYKMLDLNSELRLRGIATFGSFERRIERLFRFIDHENRSRHQTRSFTKNFNASKLVLFRRFWNLEASSKTDSSRRTRLNRG
jgi:hypothetical protein